MVSFSQGGSGGKNQKDPPKPINFFSQRTDFLSKR